jgi:hypothetical protein
MLREAVALVLFPAPTVAGAAGETRFEASEVLPSPALGISPPQPKPRNSARPTLVGSTLPEHQTSSRVRTSTAWQNKQRTT